MTLGIYLMIKMPNFAEKLDDYFARYLAHFNYKNYVDRIHLQKSEKILEIGCGGGNLSRFLARELPLGELVSIDNSQYWINEAKRRLKNFKNIEFRVEDILDFRRKNHFDAIIVHYVLHDIEKKEEVIKILKDNLKKDGAVYIRESTRENHGISPREIESLMLSEDFIKKESRHNYSFPIRGKVYEGKFEK